MWVESAVPCRVAVAAYHSQIFQASCDHIWQRYREMIQTRVSGNWRTLLTQIITHSCVATSHHRQKQLAWVRQRRQVIEMNAGWLCEVDYQGMCHEPDDRKVTAKRLYLCMRRGVSASLDYFWQAFGRTQWFSVTLLFGFSKSSQTSSVMFDWLITPENRKRNSAWEEK